ncbi:hypothetical protein [Paenibacillus sp. PvR148]
MKHKPGYLIYTIQPPEYGFVRRFLYFFKGGLVRPHIVNGDCFAERLKVAVPEWIF